jgi:RNA polymerase sigma-70 factor (ECF subfamily)
VDEAARARVEQVEREVRALCDRGDHVAAATAVLEGHGQEILSFLLAVHRDEGEAEEVFSTFAESVWTGLPRFAWVSSLRTWAYAIASHKSKKHSRSRARRERHLAHPTDSFFEGVVAKVRTQTARFLRTEKRTKLQALRDTLPEDDRSLLVLRVDRDLSWKDLALVLADEEGAGPLDDQALARESARLRKRFQALKERLREMARREGLIE